MIIHTVREPFLCRAGQFTPGERELCIGLDYLAVKYTKEFWCYIGKNKKTHYEIDSSEAMVIGQQWKNPKGRTVLIVPISKFKRVDSKWSQKDFEIKELTRAEEIAHALF